MKQIQRRRLGLLRRGKTLRFKATSLKKHKKVRYAAIAGLASFSVVFFAALSSTVIQGSYVMSPTREMAVASTDGKQGSSTPPGLNPADAAESEAVLGAKAKAAAAAKVGGTAAASTPGVIPPKGAWVNKPLYTDPTNTATQYAAANPGAEGAAYIARAGTMPVAEWFGDWNANVTSSVNRYVSAAAAKGAVPVVVAYNIPNRDCGGYSVGGASALATYTNWIRQVSAGIAGRTAVVILEPDALGAADCLPTAAMQNERYTALAQAVTILKAQANTYVYIDAGTPTWQPVSVMSTRLKNANIAGADGFSINISYFASTASNYAYGDKLSALVGYKHYVIDVSRNGAGTVPTGMQCNPSFAAFGQAPTTNTGRALNDALLWIKIPWESDGQCGTSPGPGQPYWSYAILLAKNAGW